MISLERVWLTLGDRQVLQGISFEVQPGETKVILGGSGSGKTTILRLILGLFRPDRGSIRVDGGGIPVLGEQVFVKFGRTMAMVFQGAALLDCLTVGENDGIGLWDKGRWSV